MKKTILTTVILIITAVSSFAQTTSEIKQRMADRLPVIIQMKAELSVGESNDAYLSALKPLNEAQTTLIKQENSDRKIIYTYLADQTGAPLKLVLEKRATQLRSQAIKGTMVQTPTGEWVKKS